jgi:hypothetical protein
MLIKLRLVIIYTNLYIKIIYTITYNLKEKYLLFTE